MTLCTKSCGNAPITASEARELSKENYDKMVDIALKAYYANIRQACMVGKREVKIDQVEVAMGAGATESAMRALKDQGFTIADGRIYW